MLASLGNTIPYSIWKDRSLFNHQISDFVLTLMSMEEKKLMGCLQELASKLDIRSKRCIWLAIAYSHLDWKDRTLLEVAKNLSLSSRFLFQTACIYGKSSLLDILVNEYSHSASQLKGMVVAENYYGFRKAAEHGHLNVLQQLTLWMPPQEVSKIIAEAFCCAAENGHLAVMEYLLTEISEDKIVSILAYKDYFAFSRSAENGHFQVVQYLMQLAPLHVSKMLAGGNYHGFRKACEKRHVDLIKYFIKLDISIVVKMIAADKFYVFRKMAEYGDLNLLEILIDLAPAQIQEMVAADNYYAFRKAAQNGHIDVIRFLLKLMPSKKQEMIKEADYSAFRGACGNNHFLVVELFIEWMTDNIQEMLEASQYGAFHRAAENNHLSIIMYLMDQLAPNKVQHMLSAKNYYLFKAIFQNDYHGLANGLLTIPSVFAHVEKHEKIYGQQCIYPFVKYQIALLRARKEKLQQMSTDGRRDILEEKEALLCVYLIRHLIRRRYAKNEAYQGIFFLLEFPAVSALAAQEITPGKPNELLRLALCLGDWSAANILLTVPAICVLAQKNFNYIDEQTQGTMNEIKCELGKASQSIDLFNLFISCTKEIIQINKLYNQLIEEANRFMKAWSMDSSEIRPNHLDNIMVMLNTYKSSIKNAKELQHQLKENIPLGVKKMFRSNEAHAFAWFEIINHSFSSYDIKYRLVSKFREIRRLYLLKSNLAEILKKCSDKSRYQAYFKRQMDVADQSLFDIISSWGEFMLTDQAKPRLSNTFFSKQKPALSNRKPITTWIRHTDTAIQEHFLSEFFADHKIVSVLKLLKHFEFNISFLEYISEGHYKILFALSGSNESLSNPNHDCNESINNLIIDFLKRWNSENPYIEFQYVSSYNGTHLNISKKSWYCSEPKLAIEYSKIKERENVDHLLIGQNNWSINPQKDLQFQEQDACIRLCQSRQYELLNFQQDRYSPFRHTTGFEPLETQKHSL